MRLAPKQPNLWAGDGRMHHKGKVESVACGIFRINFKEKVGDVANKSELYERRKTLPVPRDATFNCKRFLEARQDCIFLHFLWKSASFHKK